jgi:hypothetical protein
MPVKKLSSIRNIRAIMERKDRQLQKEKLQNDPIRKMVIDQATSFL